MKKEEIIVYLNNNMVKVFNKIKNTNNPNIKAFENDFLKLYNINLNNLLKKDLNNIMVEFDRIKNKIRIIEIKNK